MKAGHYSGNRSGAILVIALWSLGILTILASVLGVIVRQKISLVSRLEEKDRIRFLVESEVRKALALLNTASLKDDSNPSFHKTAYYNNEGQFRTTVGGIDSHEISYDFFNDQGQRVAKRYGMMDEESKININTADATTLRYLMRSILKLEDEKAGQLATAIIDWREAGEGEMVGFYSDVYYDNLEYPYPKKNAPFEVIDELCLVKGMDEDLFKKLLPFITVFGDGKVNINTASRITLISSGLSENLVDKILSLRRGNDRVEATEDDVMIQNISDCKNELIKSFELTEDNSREADTLITSGKFLTTSNYYFIQSRVNLNPLGRVDVVKCIYNVKDNKVEYWRDTVEEPG